MNERDFPHIVETDQPEGGFGMRLNEVHRWHNARGIISRQGRAKGREIRWCFADAATADAFAEQFGGRRIEPPPWKPRGPYDFSDLR